VNFSVQARQPGKQDTQPAGLDLLFAEELGEAPEPYERLLSDAMQGKARLFAREDSVEETWRIVQPLLETPGDPERYQPGTWDPRERASSSRDTRDGTDHGCRRGPPADTAAPRTW
jgi:glucose-6-phosphate 1-dehydrogenase